jgi:hypothetical protein
MIHNAQSAIKNAQRKALIKSATEKSLAKS